MIKDEAKLIEILLIDAAQLESEGWTGMAERQAVNHIEHLRTELEKVKVELAIAAVNVQERDDLVIRLAEHKLEMGTKDMQLTTLQASQRELVEALNSLISRLEVDHNESDYSLLKRCRTALANAAKLMEGM